MTVRALGLAVLSGAAADDCPFSDVSVAQGYVALAYRMGIIKGVSAYNFEPKKRKRRASRRLPCCCAPMTGCTPRSRSRKRRTEARRPAA